MPKGPEKYEGEQLKNESESNIKIEPDLEKALGRLENDTDEAMDLSDLYHGYGRIQEIGKYYRNSLTTNERERNAMIYALPQCFQEKAKYLVDNRKLAESFSRAYFDETIQREISQERQFMEKIFGGSPDFERYYEIFTAQRDGFGRLSEVIISASHLRDALNDILKKLESYGEQR